MMSTNTFSNILGWVWIISWFASVWAPTDLALKLFLTGLLSVTLGFLIYNKEEV